MAAKKKTNKKSKKSAQVTSKKLSPKKTSKKKPASNGPKKTAPVSRKKLKPKKTTGKKKPAIKKPKKSAQVTSKKINPKKKTAKKKPASKGRIPNKQSQKKAAPKKAVIKKAVKESKSPRPKPIREISQIPETDSFSPELADLGIPELLSARSGGQAGDLQGLSTLEGADSESVVELLEEGNSFEAGVVVGIENAENDEQGEVQTRQVPEDDVPEEYLDRE